MDRSHYFEQMYDDWQASNLPIDEFLTQTKKEQVRNIFNGTTSPGSGTRGHASGTPPKWNNIQEMMAYMKAHPPDSSARGTPHTVHVPRPKPSPKKVDPEYRRREIEYELDVIRGRVPTPKGYTVNPGKVKDLMLELKSLTT